MKMIVEQTLDPGLCGGCGAEHQKRFYFNFGDWTKGRKPITPAHFCKFCLTLAVIKAFYAGGKQAERTRYQTTNLQDLAKERAADEAKN
jgi:hypothetical protein